ncbi:unnamed protein product, partial [Porites lobata]
GPTGYPGPTGARGPRGRRGPKGKKGLQGPMGPAGKSGKNRTNWETKGDPGKSISAPQVMLSPTGQTRDEGENTAFYCTVAENPSPVVEGQFKGRKLLSGAKYFIKEGELIVRNLNYSDAGPYSCAARNILGMSEAISYLTVRGKRNTVLLLFLGYFLLRECENTRFKYTLCLITGVLISLKRNTLNFSLAKRIKLTLILHFAIWLSYLFANTSVDINSVSVKFQILCTSYNEKWSFFPLGLENSVIVRNNKNHLTSLRDWLAPVAKSVNSLWKRCWRASVDGWAASTFHSVCNGKGPTVTIIRVGRYIFGGYTSKSWASGSGRYQYDSKAFLFSLVNKPGWAPVKLSHYRKYSTFFRSSYGPRFGGGHDIHISNYASSNSNSYSNLGWTYSPPSGYSVTSTFARTFLAGTYRFTADEVETFYETT